MRRAFVKTINNSTGATLMELIISMGIMGIVISSASLVTRSVSTQMIQADRKISTSEFGGLLASYILNKKHCDFEFAGLNVGNGLAPPPPKNIPNTIGENLVMGAYRYAVNGANVVGLASGSSVDAGVVLESLTWRRGVTFDTIFKDNVTFRRYELTVNLDMRFESGTVGNRMRAISFPVLTNAAGRIMECYKGEAMTLADTCRSAGRSWIPMPMPPENDPDNQGRCPPTADCDIHGSYVTRSCSPSSYGCPASSFYSGYQNTNPAAGNAASCPGGSTREVLGESLSTFTASCGKKCTATVNRTEKLNACLVCGTAALVGPTPPPPPPPPIPDWVCMTYGICP